MPDAVLALVGLMLIGEAILLASVRGEDTEAPQEHGVPDQT